METDIFEELNALIEARGFKGSDKLCLNGTYKRAYTDGKMVVSISVETEPDEETLEAFGG